MNISSIKTENLAQYATLLANPAFINAIKSVAKKSGDGKYDALLNNLEKLGSLISDSNSPVSSDSGVSSLYSSSSSSPSSSVAAEAQMYRDANAANRLQNQALGDIINEIINNAELLADIMMDFEMVPPTDELIALFEKFREIISKLDKESRELHKEIEDKKTKEVYKLLPSSNTKSGFVEGLILVAK